MASPLNDRGKAAARHLLKTSQPANRLGTKKDKEVQRISKKLLDPTYLRNLKKRLREGKCQPGVEAMVWYFAHGKPPEIVETKLPVSVRIQNIFTNDEDEKK